MRILGLLSIVWTMTGFGGGIALGIVAGYFMFIHFESDDVKEPVPSNLYKLDFKGLQELLPEIPLWIKSPDYEKVDWLNKFMEEMWPYINKAVCKIIRETAEPYIAEYKPKFNLQSVEFKSLTLGTLPPVFMGVKIHETQEKELIFEVAVKFAGNPDIKVAVKAYGLEAVAQLVDAQVFATARITLKPLVPAFPCFSGICVSLLEKPHVDFGLKVFNTDLMAIPLLDRYVQGMIQQTVASMCLWPNKLEIPILSQEKGSREAQGVLIVTVLLAKQLRNADFLGLSDPYVKLKLGVSTQKTKVIMNNLNPEWNETFTMIVDDPETDALEISVWDWDKVGGHDKLGVQVVRLKQLNPDDQQTFTLNLLKNYDQSDPANKKNRGQITLALEYKQFDGNEEEDEETDFEQIESENNIPDLSIPKGSTVSFDPSPVTIAPTTTGGGLLVVIVHAAEDVEGKSHTNPYARIIFRGEKKRSKVIKRNRDPRWEAEFEFVLDDSPVNDRLLVEIKSKGTGIIHYRESLGHVEIDLADVVRNRRINEKYQLLDSKNGKVHVELQWKTTGIVSLKRSQTNSHVNDKSPRPAESKVENVGPITPGKHHSGPLPNSGVLPQGKFTP
ncbi:unnamed protein product [Calypogeia fissa]